VDVLVLKGAGLAHSIYPRPELRPYADLDLLCRPDGYAKLHRALVTAGYASDDLATLPRRHSSLEGYPERAFSSPVAGVRVELHSGILELGLLEHSHDALWAAAQTVEVDGRRVPILAPIHQILHLAVHVHRHGYRRLLWLDDLALAMHRWRDELDWPAVMRLARMEGAGAVLRHAVAVAHVVLGVSPPDLGPPTPEEVLLHTAYRILWPLGRAQQLQGEEHQRRLRFEPGTGSLLDVAPGLLLLGRRREKWRILRLYRRPRIRKTGRPF
ncbi:MAG: nucleotidyltransferase family protein, partial [Chloroflexota bacterium]